MNKSMTSGSSVCCIPINTEEQRDELENLAALGYSTPELAIYYNIPLEDFEMEANDPHSELNYHIRRGQLMSMAKEHLAIQGDAQKGNIVASQRLSQIRRDRGFELSKLDVFGGFEDATRLQRITDYIHNGSRDKISNDEALYIETLSQINAMDRQYGRRNTIAFFTGKPFNLSYAKARDMYDEAQNLFYIDRNVNKKALRNKKAEQMEEAARQVFINAKSARDYEIYVNILMQVAKLQELDKPEMETLPKEAYLRPIRVFSLDAADVGLPAVNRQEIAQQIDALDISEIDKNQKKRDAFVTDVDFYEVINSSKQ